MSEKTSLDGAQAKLNRAIEHLNDLNAATLEFLETDPYELWGDLQEEAGKYVVGINVKEPAPLRLGAMFGDLIHNLRSCLDHVVYELVRLNGRNPNRDKTAFPIYEDEPVEGFAAATRESLRGVGDAPRTLIEEFQPYNRAEPGRLALGTIRRFSNRDKHRTLVGFLAVLDASSEPGFWFAVNKDVRLGQHMTMYPGRPLEHDAELLSVPVTILGPNPKVEMQGPMKMQIAFGENRPLRVERIPATVGEVIRVVRAFRPFFERLW